jgi:hypothetical protein
MDGCTPGPVFSLAEGVPVLKNVTRYPEQGLLRSPLTSCCLERRSWPPSVSSGENQPTSLAKGLGLTSMRRTCPAGEWDDSNSIKAHGRDYDSCSHSLGVRARSSKGGWMNVKPVTGNERLNVLHRFAGRCGYPWHSKRHQENTRTEYRRRISS